MVRQGFSVGSRDWYVMCYYDIRTDSDLDEVHDALIAGGCTDGMAREAIRVLSGWNKGYTFSNLKDHLSLVFIGKAVDAEQMYDSIQHELKHVTEHISDAYGVNPKGEESAYLQGELGRKMFPAAAYVICPHCN